MTDAMPCLTQFAKIGQLSAPSCLPQLGLAAPCAMMVGMVDDDQGPRPRAPRRAYPAAFLHGRAIVAAGVVAAIGFPLLGVMIGMVLLYVRRFTPGAGCILLSVAAGMLWYLVEHSLEAGPHIPPG